ncbi:hypothetical protein [Crocinitomix catalasitica]|uniref:hypothetical protein n=1 Tax=Crocinitomix catalasitica TaxID=184607 RepID=UPI0004834CD4|nr:hypothetical protein [Crocinitomix catalasitica]
MELILGDSFYFKRSNEKGLELLLCLRNGNGIYFDSNDVDFKTSEQINVLLSFSFKKIRIDEIVESQVLRFFKIEGVGFYFMLSDQTVLRIYDEPADVYENDFMQHFDVLSKNNMESEYVEMMDDIHSLGIEYFV